MTADVELLPLPEPKVQHDAFGGLYTPLQVHACVAHATAPLQAEIEALREEASAVKKSLSTDIELLPLPEPRVKTGNHLQLIYFTGAQMVHHARANMAPLIAEIERLRAEREVIVAEAIKYAGKSGRLEAEVERLAEALKQARGSIEEWAYFAQSCGGELSGLQKELSEIDLALRDHDQEKQDEQ